MSWRSSTNSHYHYCFIKAVYASWLSFLPLRWKLMGNRGRDFCLNLGQRAARVERSDRPLPDWIGKMHMFNRYPLEIIGLIIHNTERQRFVNSGPQRLNSDTNIKSAFSELEATCQADRLGPNCFKCEYMQMLCGEERREPGGHWGEAGSRAVAHRQRANRDRRHKQGAAEYASPHHTFHSDTFVRSANTTGNNSNARLYMVLVVLLIRVHLMIPYKISTYVCGGDPR